MPKPYRGEIYYWRKVPFDMVKAEALYGENVGLGYVIEGYRTQIPKFGSFWRTSWVVHQDADGNVETRNSLYKVVGPEETEYQDRAELEEEKERQAREYD